MSDVVKIKITKIGKKQQPSKFKEGDTYTIATIMDEYTGRKASGFGKWTDDWKEGHEFNGIWVANNWKDKDGFEQKGWNIENPDKKEYTGPRGGAAATLTIIHAYTIAAALAPVIFADKKKIVMSDIEKLVEAVKTKLDASAPNAEEKTEEKKKVKDIDVDKEDKKSSEKTGDDEDFDVDEDDDDPFA